MGREDRGAPGKGPVSDTACAKGRPYRLNTRAARAKVGPKSERNERCVRSGGGVRRTKKEAIKSALIQILKTGENLLYPPPPRAACSQQPKPILAVHATAIAPGRQASRPDTLFASESDGRAAHEQQRPLRAAWHEQSRRQSHGENEEAKELYLPEQARAGKGQNRSQSSHHCLWPR